MSDEEKEITIVMTGSCFDDSLDFISERVAAQTGIEGIIDCHKRLRLVHGICLPPDGKPFSHGWVEEDGDCWMIALVDGRLSVCLVARADFYEKLRIQESTAYTLNEVLDHNERTGHYGPWEDRYWNLCKNVIAGEKPKSELHNQP